MSNQNIINQNRDMIEDGQEQELEETNDNLFSEFNEDTDTINQTLEKSTIFKNEVGLDCWCYDNKGHWIQSIEIDDVMYGLQWNNDGSIFCLLCMIDDHAMCVPIHDIYEPIHTNEEFINHIRFCHLWYHAGEKMYVYSQYKLSPITYFYLPLEDCKKIESEIQTKVMNNNVYFGNHNRNELAIYLKQKIKRRPLDHDFLKGEAALTVEDLRKSNRIKEMMIYDDNEQSEEETEEKNKT